MIIEYQCDTCKRTIEKTRAIKGLEVIGRCTITHGCRGSLSQVATHQDFTRPSTPAHVPGLTDWTARKVLFEFTKSIKESEWIIEHNLNSNPAISVYVVRPTLEDPYHMVPMKPLAIETIDKNKSRVKFSQAESGVAQLVSRQTANPSDHIVEAPATIAPNMQLSSKGEVTIAVSAMLATQPHMALTATITTPQNISIDINYAIDDQPTTRSPWRDMDNVIVNGKVYKIYSFDAIVPEMVLGTIPSGSRITFSNLIYGNNSQRALNTNDALLLLSSKPYELVDKVLDQYVDAVHKTDDAKASIYYDNSEFHVSISLPQKTYPLIRST